ncbi:MAG: hypothetical protein QGG42_03905 [Phycisphaerae bacterium]|jgi:hypothetical protein|nr:hypothetical protein [Phycisphaerae bacterium]
MDIRVRIHKVLTPAVIALAVLVSSQAEPAKGADKAPNLLPNFSFEDKVANGARGWGTQAWSGKDRVLWGIESSGKSGKRCVSIRSAGGSDAAWIAIVKVEPNTHYELSGWIKTSAIRGAKGAMFNIQALKGSETPAVTGTTGWTQVSRVFKTNNKTEVQVNCLFGGWGRSTGQAWYDDVSLVKLSGQPDRKAKPVAVKRTPAPKAARPDGTEKNSSDFDAAAAVKRCGKFAFVKRKHLGKPFGVGTLYCWRVYSPGCGIYVYDPANPQEGQKEIFRSDDGVIYDMNPSFDAKKLLFSWMRVNHTPEERKSRKKLGYRGNPDSFHVFEINVDGTGLRRITTGRFHDVHPIYLPNGRIAFTSTRGKSYSMCQPGLSSALFTMNADGSDIKRIEFSTLASMSPYVLDDGSILFMRWEYLDKSLFTLQSLWTVNPDGTRVQLFYGNTITNPNVIWQAKSIPGTQKVLATLGPHHGNPVGAIGIIDRSLGTENPAAITNITPEYFYGPSKKVHSGGGPGDRQWRFAFRDPWPVKSDLFLVSYGGPARGGPGRYRIYALDAKGNRTLVCEDPKTSCFNPVPLAPRKRPKTILPIAPSKEKYGTFFVSDVNLGLVEKGIKRGTVKEIRIMSQLPKRCNMRGRRVYDHDPVISRGSYYVKVCLGTVPIEADGSAHFKAPTGCELYFQAVDADGKEIIRMGSTTQIMPGERQSCVGCHEPRNVTAPVTRRIAFRRPPSETKPPPWGKSGPVSFVKHVQPILDRHCIKCHSGPAPKGKMDLSGDKTQYFNMAYDSLLSTRKVHYIYINKGLTDNFKPLETGSHASALTKLIETDHGPDVKMAAIPDRDRRIIYTWIDANCPYYDTYDNTRPGTPGSRDLWIGPWIGQLKAALKATRARIRMGVTDINLTHPEYSRLLTGSLARSAGGMADDAKAVFKSKSDPNYAAILKAIHAGKKALDSNPRVDMPNARPVAYPTDFGGLYTGFAGP